VMAALSASGASAQSTFHVKEFDFDRGHWVFESVNAYQGGFQSRSARVQGGHELGIAYAPNDFWLPKILVSFHKEEDESYHLQGLMFENVVKLKPLASSGDGFGIAWFQSVEAALNDQQTNTTVFGPILTAQTGRFSISVNPFLDKTFGQNHERGMNFSFAWQAR